MTTLYLDMDGVVADFDSYAKTVLNTDSMKHSWPEHEWKKIASNPRLYRDLKRTTEADDLVIFCTNLCNKNNWDLLFLTAVPKDNDMPWAFYDKVQWVQKYYPSIPVHFGPHSHDKWKHCIKGDILIDDRPSNIEQWNKADGIGILHKGNLSDTLMQLLKVI